VCYFSLVPLTVVILYSYYWWIKLLILEILVIFGHVIATEFLICCCVPIISSNCFTRSASSYQSAITAKCSMRGCFYLLTNWGTLYWNYKEGRISRQPLGRNYFLCIKNKDYVVCCQHSVCCKVGLKNHFCCPRGSRCDNARGVCVADYRKFRPTRADIFCGRCDYEGKLSDYMHSVHCCNKGAGRTWRGAVVERRSLTGELSLSCARPAADGWPPMWVNRPL